MRGSFVGGRASAVGQRGQPDQQCPRADETEQSGRSRPAERRPQLQAGARASVVGRSFDLDAR
ncbi:MAG TPA: hypothetical protein VGF65_15960, partial [Mycobacterium sp.]